MYIGGYYSSDMTQWRFSRYLSRVIPIRFREIEYAVCLIDRVQLDREVDQYLSRGWVPCVIGKEIESDSSRQEYDEMVTDY